jgi:hypothetical protein
LTRALVLAALAASVASASWSEPRVLSDTGIALGPELAMSSSGAALAVWDGEDGPECAQSPASLTCIHIVEVAARDGSTGVWGWGDRIARPGVGARPTVALNEAGRAAVLWVHDIGRDRVVQATYRTGATERFPNPSDLSAAVLEVRGHHIALDAAGNAVAVWAERHAGDFGVAAEVRSVASGTWGAPVVLSTGSVRAGPRLAVTPAGEAFAVWIEGSSVLLARGDLTTGVWDAPLTLSRNAGVGATVAVNPVGDAVAVWALGDRPGVEASVRPAGGSWAGPVSLIDGGQLGANAGPDAGFAANGTVVAVWVGGGSLRSSARSRDGSWSRPVEVGAADSADPRVAVDPQGDAIVVWQHRSRLLTALRPAAAGAWQPSEQLSGAEASAPQVALDAAGNGVVVWNWRDSDLLPVMTADLPAAWEPTLTNTRRPAVRGVARVGHVLHCDRGTWAGTQPIGYSLGWLRNGKAIARAARYRVRRADVGDLLACRVRATNGPQTAVAVSKSVRARP